MIEQSTPDILIIGAGAAGLAAAVALSGAGATVSLLERKPFVGGRAYSYPHPALNEVVDSQHVLLGCCTNLVDLCNLSGASDHIRWYDTITFLEPSTRSTPSRRSDIAPSGLLSPAHSALSFLHAPMLSLEDKTRIGLGLLEFFRSYPTSDTEPFSAWLKRTHQTDRAIRHFWEPIIVGTLNDHFDRCSTRYAGQVFHESFLKSAQGGRLGIPSQPLSDFYAAIASLAAQQGTALYPRTSIERIDLLPKGLWQVTASNGDRHQAPTLLLALPFEQTARLLATLPETSAPRQRIEPSLSHFTHAPITTVHLWFDRPVTDLEHAALLDTRIQWMFNKTLIRRLEPTAVSTDGQYLELVISASVSELRQTSEQILAFALVELARFFPAIREAKLLKSGVLKEARATFSVTPGLDRFRPTPEAPGDNLYLAGDWTLSGWPSTMEGAVRSGRSAAEAIARTTGNSTTFLIPPLPPAGLMKLFAR
jgi:squalene-associated FAD-dependent desaturase